MELRSSSSRSIERRVNNTDSTAVIVCITKKLEQSLKRLSKNHQNLMRAVRALGFIHAKTPIIISFLRRYSTEHTSTRTRHRDIAEIVPRRQRVWVCTCSTYVLTRYDSASWSLIYGIDTDESQIIVCFASTLSNLPVSAQQFVFRALCSSIINQQQRQLAVQDIEHYLYGRHIRCPPNTSASGSGARVDPQGDCPLLTVASQILPKPIEF